MTSGYDPSIPGRHHVPAPPSDDGQWQQGRPGPLPPRIEPTGAHGPVTGQLPAAPVTSQLPAQAGPYPTGPVSYAGGPYPGAPAGPHPGFGPPLTSAPPAPVAVQPRRGGHLGTVAFVVAMMLLLVVVVQTVFLVNLNSRLNVERRNAAAVKADAQSRLQGLESRTGDIERRVIDPQSVAKDVLPSVFVVEAGKSLGTAFALGKDNGAGGTDLITNYHVVKDVYVAGGRSTALVRDDKRFEAKIIKVDPNADLTLLHTNEKFPRLVAARSQAQSGQPIVVVGAPLGLESTVTTGVISAYRPDTQRGPLLQFDAAVNPGNSGGPLVNAQREVVGVTVSGISQDGVQGINFAIPVSVVCQSFAIC